MGTSNGPSLGSGVPPVTVHLLVRAPVDDDSTAAIDRLSALKINDRLAGFEVDTVRGDVLLAETEDAALPPPLACWQSLVDWESDGLESALEAERQTTRTGRCVRTVTPPDRAAAVSVRGELACVFPCTNGERTWTVTDFLDDYESDGELPVERTGRELEV